MVPPPSWSIRLLLVSGIAALLLAFGATPSTLAASAGPAAERPAALYLIDLAYGDALRPLLFQVVGMGFRPGEAVRVQATIMPAGGPAVTLAPVAVIADGDGNVTAMLLGAGLGAPADGFIVRAIGDEHRASIIDVVTGGASVTAAPSGRPIGFVG